MGFASFDHKGKRYWMGAGNVRTCKELESSIEKKEKTSKDLEEFLAKTAVSVTTPVETAFKHPFEGANPAEQRGPGFEGVPESELAKEAPADPDETKKESA